MQVEVLTQKIQTLPKPTSRPLIIAISGFGGSGKTTLANALRAKLRDAQIVSIDSFSNHEWHRNADWDNFNRDRFAHEILRPARANKFPLSYTREAWPGHVDELTTSVPKTAYFIVEGCSIFHPDLLKYYDYKIWVDCPLKEATQRGIRRDQHINKDPMDEYWQNIWMPNDRDFYQKYRPDKAADIKYTTSNN